MKWLPVLAALLWAGHTSAQVGYRARYFRVEEPQWLKLQITGFNAGIYMEGTIEETSLNNSGPSTTYERFFVAPALGLAMQGSIYHPNFFRFQLSGEGAYGWAEQMTTTGSRREHNEDFQVYGNYQGSAQLFANKPLNASLYSSYGRSYREYDFFTQVTVETLGYGTRIVYSNPWLDLRTTYAHTDEDVSDTSSPYTSEQDLVSFDARNSRPKGATSFNYTYNQYNRTGGFDTSDHTLSLADGEQFGSQDQIGVNASVTASRRESEALPEDQLSANAGLNIKHDPKLTSDYSFNFDRFETADFTSQSYAGRAGVQHQLYESLFSSLSVNASDADSTSDLNTGFSRQYGGGIAEAYTKRLGTNHRLRIDASAFIVHIDQKSTGRAVNEQHIFPVPPSLESFLLNLPSVIESTITVSDSGNLVRFVRDIDYEVFPVGVRTEIRRIIGGAIPQGSTVRVDYQAQPTPEAGYETHTETAGIRVELWNNVWGVYSRFAHTGNNAPSELNTFESTSYTFGTDLNWLWLRAGTEYERYNSTDTDYWSGRLYQSGSFVLDSASSLNIGFSESYTQYLDDDRQEQNYRFTSTYHRALSSGFNGNVQAGVGLRRGTEVDQTLAVLRPELNYVFGRTTVQFVYNFEYNLYQQSEERIKHLFTLRVRREF